MRSRPPHSTCGSQAVPACVFAGEGGIDGPSASVDVRCSTSQLPSPLPSTAAPVVRIADRPTGTRLTGAGRSLLGRAASPDQGSPGAAKAHTVTLAPGLGGPWRFLVRLRGPAEEGGPPAAATHPRATTHPRTTAGLLPLRERAGVWGRAPHLFSGWRALPAVAPVRAAGRSGTEAGAAAHRPSGRRAARMRGALNPTDTPRKKRASPHHEPQVGALGSHWRCRQDAQNLGLEIDQVQCLCRYGLGIAPRFTGRRGTPKGHPLHLHRRFQRASIQCTSEYFLRSARTP